MSREENGTVALIAVALVGAIICFALLAAKTTVAQTSTPAWEYAALAYDGDTAFAYTNDPTATHELNVILESMTGDDLNSIAAMNVMGANGWDYVDYQPGATVVYMFKRPLE